MTILRQYLLIIVAALSFIVMPEVANAQYTQLFCNNSGGVGGGALFWANQASDEGACQFQGIQHVFSQIVCNIVVILNNVLGQMYCGIQYAVTPLLGLALVLYIAIFGMQLLMGVVQLNAKEVVIRLLKIAGVWAFATKSTFGLTIMFQFFFGAMAESSRWVVESINPNLTGANPDAGDFGNFMDQYQFLDNLIYAAISAPFSQANNTVIGFFVALLLFFPSLSMMAVTWLISTILMLMDTLVDFLLSLSIIALLIAISPIFLSFMLFKPTQSLFEDWLKFLISYTLQIVIIIAIIALWISAISLFGGFFTQLSNLIVPIQNVVVDFINSPNDTFGICDYTMSWSPPGNPGGACVPGLPCMPSLTCICPPPSLTCNGAVPALTPSQLQSQEDFIFFMGYNLVALLLIAHAFGTLVKNAPSIAQSLSGPAQVPPLRDNLGGHFTKLANSLGLSSGGGAGSDTAPAGSGNPLQSFLNNAANMVTGRGGDRPPPRP